jgi:hypothetical protein
MQTSNYENKKTIVPWATTLVLTICTIYIKIIRFTNVTNIIKMPFKCRKTKQKQSRETGNIGYTRWRKTKQKQSRETGNIGYTRRRKTKQKHNTICRGHHYTQANSCNVSKIGVPLHTPGCNDEPNIDRFHEVLCYPLSCIPLYTIIYVMY